MPRADNHRLPPMPRPPERIRRQGARIKLGYALAKAQLAATYATTMDRDRCHAAREELHAMEDALLLWTSTVVGYAENYTECREAYEEALELAAWEPTVRRAMLELALQLAP